MRQCMPSCDSHSFHSSICHPLSTSFISLPYSFINLLYSLINLQLSGHIIHQPAMPIHQSDILIHKSAMLIHQSDILIHQSPILIHFIHQSSMFSFIINRHLLALHSFRYSFCPSHSFNSPISICLFIEFINLQCSII